MHPKRKRKQGSFGRGLVGARSVEQKNGADGGVDGKVFFRDHPDAKAKPQVILFSVKGGNLKLDDVRALDSGCGIQDHREQHWHERLRYRGCHPTHRSK